MCALFNPAVMQGHADTPSLVAEQADPEGPSERANRDRAMNRTLLAAILIGASLAAAWCPAPAAAQYPGTGIDEFPTGDLFAPLDLSGYDGGPPPNEGWFADVGFTLQRFTGPDRVVVPQNVFLGPPVPVPFSAFGTRIDWGTTAEFGSSFQEGARIEFGYMRDDVGWEFVYNIYGDNTVEFQSVQEVDGIQVDPLLGVAGDRILAQNNVVNTTDVYSVELNRLWRLPLRRVFHGPVVEVSGGFRFFRFDDKFNTGNFLLFSPGGILIRPVLPWPPGSTLFTTKYSGFTGGIQGFSRTQAVNHLFGPQIGGSWSWKRGAARLEIDGRLMAAFNTQSVRTQTREIAFSYDLGSAPILTDREASGDVTDVEHNFDFLPVAELHVGANYQVTRMIELQVGWSGTYFGEGIGLATQFIDPITFNLVREPDKKDFFIHGLRLSVVVNR